MRGNNRKPEIFRGTSLKKVGLSLYNRDSWQLCRGVVKMHHTFLTDICACDGCPPNLKELSCWSSADELALKSKPHPPPILGRK